MDTTKPLDTVLASELAAYIRETRVFANALAVGAGFGFTALTVPLGTTQLTVGSELLAVGIEVITVTGGGAATLTHILGGTAGQIKIFIFQDTLVRMDDGNLKDNGLLYLNHLPTGSDFSPNQDDIICLINIDGDGRVNHGYWKEVLRTLSLK
jgi:hypothetical protein